jgi:hypothetical protein
MALHPPLSPLTHQRDNVTAPHGRPNRRSQLHFCHVQVGGPRSPKKDMWWNWGKNKLFITFTEAERGVARYVANNK